jgi:photosystem II reaction center protein PsbP
MKKSLGKISAVLSIVMLISLFVTIGWLVYKNNQLKQEKSLPLSTETISPSPTTIISPSIIPTIDPMENWQTYSNNEDCFSFKYPKELTFEMQADLAHLSIWGPTQKKDTGFYDGLSLTFSPSLTINVPLSDYVDGKIDESKQFGEIIKAKIEITINGINGYTFTTQGMGKFENIYLQAKDKSCTVEITNASVDPTNQGYQEMVNDILSTFEFSI